MAHHGMCAICGGTGDLVDDHDHETGLVRGRLCRFCNAKEGHADNDGIFGKYRERNPASILGISVRYWSPWSGYAEPSDRAAQDLDTSPVYKLAALLAKRE